MDKWKQLERREVYGSPFMRVWEDTVELPNGVVLDDFSGVTLPDGVLVVATDTEDNLLLFDEYKYAVNDTVLTFPAGGIDGDESPEQAAARELLEETGYESNDLEILAKTYPYPSKITHTNYIVRAKNAVKTTTETLGEAETVGKLQKVPVAELHELRISGAFTTPYMLAAIALAFPGDF